ncbi:Protein of unknown function [Lactobacillus helveticus CIRM-BIA 953]|uniref:Uncharacterized protein n=1 Tax=Lactobacillus helveticus CIRM-BIA 953 TaxID=1226335 RepID=U4QMU1_LACHE|nr:Protein of unknown function [Lactobacillus helveticus CIRM-BIA 953]
MSASKTSVIFLVNFLS